MENLPTGWTTISMNLRETLSNSFGSALGIAMETGVGLAAKYIGKKAGLKKGETESMADIFKAGKGLLDIGKGISTVFGSSDQSPAAQAVEKMVVPK